MVLAGRVQQPHEEGKVKFNQYKVVLLSRLTRWYTIFGNLFTEFWEKWYVQINPMVYYF